MQANTVAMTSAEALQRLARGRDSAAWELLVDRHGGEILRVCARILNDAALAEDACQETLLQVRDKAAQFTGSGAENVATARAWILRIAANTALQTLRQRKRDALRDAAMGRGKETAMTAETQAETAERSAAVRRELGTLNEDERLPIVLHYYAGMPYEELATSLGCPIGTAKARVSRGVEKLRQRLAMLGIILALGDLEGWLSGTAQAAEAAAPSAAQLATWKGLLNSPLHVAAESGGIGSMATGKETGATSMGKLILAFGAGMFLLAFGYFMLTKSIGGSGAGGSPATITAPAGVTVAAPTETGTPAPAPTPPPAAPKAEAQPEDIKAVVDANSRFAFDLYNRLGAAKPGNLVYSPFSVSTALSMVLAGAGGSTQEQLTRVLRLPAEVRTHRVFEVLLNDFKRAGKGYQLHIGNRVWMQKGDGVDPLFLETTRTHYDAPAMELDFRNDAESARRAINHWIAEQTKDRIKDILSEGSVNKDTGIVLANAVYFKADWLSKFKEHATYEREFKLTAAQTAKVATMHQTGQFRYADAGADYHVVELPYAGGEASCLVLLPKKVDGLAAVESSLTVAGLDALTAKLEAREVALALPKFKLETGMGLIPALRLLGLNLAFTPEANFSGMNAGRKLFVNDVAHRAFIAVDEEGTEAAAATVATLSDGKDAPNIVIFNVDRPFMFMLRHNKTGSILFMGRVTDPRGN